MAIGTAAAIGLGAAGLGSFLGGKSQSKAATKAADTSLAVARENNALAANIFNRNEARLAPVADAGTTARGFLESALGYGDPDDFQKMFGRYIENSDYGFQFQEGGNALNSGYAGAGTLQSGAAMKDMERFRQNLQSGYRGEYMNALANQQSLGLAAGSALAGVGQSYVNTVGANNNNAGSAVANAALIKGANNPFANALGMVGGGLWGMGK
jgi:hypothetical protein